MENSVKIDGIYDRLPRFVTESVNYIDGKYLHPVVRDFDWDGRRFVFVISPARVRDEKGEDKHYFPGKLEEMIETVLRELAVKENPNFIAEESTLYFSRSELLDEFAGIAGDLVYKKSEIDLGLNILADIKYELIYRKTGAELYFRPIENLSVYEKNGKLYYRARLLPLLLDKNDQIDFCFPDKGIDKIRLSKRKA